MFIRKRIIEGKEMPAMVATVIQDVFVSQLGIAAPALLDYLIDMLIRFIRIDALHKLRDAEGNRLVHVADMLTEAEQRIAKPQLEAYRHIGDITLFRCGFMLHTLHRNYRRKNKPDHLLDYFEQGKRSYLLASRCDSDEAPVLCQLSHEFEACAYGLNLVSQKFNRAA